METEEPQAASLGPSNLSSKEHNFEAVFRIPSSHDLVVIRSRTQGGETTTVAPSG
jgi:hypothetical protein